MSLKLNAFFNYGHNRWKENVLCNINQSSCGINQTSLFSLKSKYEAEVQRSHTCPFLEGFVQTSGDI